ncbi:MAG: hypothetical protein R6V61_12895 [Wenzhouxiangellaceae bacterium]
MQSESIVLLSAAAASVSLLLLLRSLRSKLYNQSAGVGLVLISFPTSLAAFADVQWWVAVLLGVVGAGIWLTDLFGKP